jgi:glycyl-tRNA synthetase beta chain
MIKPLLIEVGVEELPAVPFIKELPNIERKWLDILEKNSLGCEFNFYYTPRRLVLWHREFPTSQKDSVEEFFGAPLQVAYKDGEPTPACIGFAKKCGVDIDQLSKSEKNGKECLYYKKDVKGKPSKELLHDMVNEFIKSLNFGKSMRWGSLEESFIRPIRWLLVKLGNEDISVESFGIKSFNGTYMHRSFGYEPFVVNEIGDYFCNLPKNGVVLFQDERKDIICEQIRNISSQNSINIEIDEELLSEVVAITEHPKALLGTFDEEFLSLPDEVIITSMKEHQRYFAVFKDGKLTNNFVVVSNSVCDDYSKIITGNEKVLKARLKDAMFFWKNDIKNGWQNSRLKDVQFIDGLGSLDDKVQREKEIVKVLAKMFLPNLEEKLVHTISIAKADLMSEMVYEFTELQGIMGSYYAQKFGEDQEVATAIKEQYLPSGEDSCMPSSTFSAIVALAYKLDLLLGLFSINKIPTGTKDPFALRRAVIGILKIVIESGLEFDIKEVINQLSPIYKNIDTKKLDDFINERIYQFFDVNISITKSILNTGDRNILSISGKVNALDSIVNSDKFREDFSTFKRVSNIIKDVEKFVSVDEKLFNTDEEKELYSELQKVESKEHINYEEHLDELFALKPHIDKFFDNVMVNDKDEAIKNNRQQLLMAIYSSFLTISDIKEISI